MNALEKLEAWGRKGRTAEIRQGRTPAEAAEFAEAAAKVLELPPEWVRLTAALVRDIKAEEVAGG